ncbi:MAG: ribonuclease HII [Verrucomicrobiota bacterium]|nr:ribonuclease HII [Verrucomicrobiota bacterium]
MLRFERQYWNQGLRKIAGVDEAGRGPLAGPVVAAAVMFEQAFAEAEQDGLLRGLTDSKQLAEATRERFHAILLASPNARIGVGIADVAEIDALNIFHATRMAMIRAVSALPSLPEHILVDGAPIAGFPAPSTAIVGGDGKSLSVAAASVIAKVTRDLLMKELDRTDSRYGFARHKGYGTRAHMKALFEHGPSPAHRRSFRPVREAAAIRSRRETSDE